jgi:putative DNA primase/helicase
MNIADQEPRSPQEAAAGQSNSHVTGNRLQLAACNYTERGFSVVPLVGKQPSCGNGWQKLRLTTDDVPRYFNGRHTGVGVLLGLGLVDVNLDSPEARRLAPKFLPATMCYGRRSSPASHYLYYAEACRSEKFEDPLIPDKEERRTLLELRSSVGLQSALPPSTHPSGELYDFEPGGNIDPARVDDLPKLKRVVAHLAAASLLLRHWPPNGGGRHHAMLALAGLLQSVGFQEEEAVHFGVTLYQALPDPDPAAYPRLLKEIEDTFRKHAEGKPTTGIPSLEKHLPEKVVAKVLEWLGEATEVVAADRINFGDDLYVAVTKAEQILATNPNLQLFQRGNLLVRVVQARSKPEAEELVRRPEGNCFLATMNGADVELLLSSLRCVYRSRGKRTDPKRKWCDQVVARIAKSADTPWRELEAFTHVPLLREDGSLVDRPGYDASSKVWFDPRGFEFPAIPDKPTEEEARAALGKFRLVFGEFPFIDSSYAAVLGTLLSVLVPNLVSTKPMLAVNAAQPGSGKTKVAEAISASSTGRSLSRMSYIDTKEFDKTLPLPLQAGDQLILIDNVDHVAVNSAVLAMCLSTDQPVEFRILGESRTVKLRNHAVFIVTGNALIISGDLPRRTLLSRLDPNDERPETRKFKFDPVDRARQMFPELAMAGLTALRWWLQAGCPRPSNPSGDVEIGSFEAWNRLVRGLLIRLEVGDPWGGQEELRLENPQQQHDVEILQAFEEEFGSLGRDVRGKLGKEGKVWKFAVREIAHSSAGRYFSDKNGNFDHHKAGLRLRHLRDQVLDGLKLVVAARAHGAVYYQVVRMSELEEHGDLRLAPSEQDDTM